MARWWSCMLLVLTMAGCAAPTGSTGRESTLAGAALDESAQMAIEVFALNNLGAEEHNGLLIEIDRVVIGQKRALADRGFTFLNDGPFADTRVAGQILFKVANRSDQSRTVFPDRGAIEINGERIELAAFADAATRFGQPISGELPPGYRANGGLWFGIARSALPDVTGMTLIVPLSGDGDDALRFELDLSDRRYDPVPENRH
jgi:hypothetical protein